MRKIVFALIAVCVLLSGCQGKKDEVLRIAAVLPMSGQAAVTGDHIMKSAELCIDKWNKVGVSGCRVEIKYYDNQGQSKLGATIANQIVSTTKIDKVLGTFGGAVLSAKPIYEQNKVLHLNFVATNDVLSDAEYALRCFPTTEDVCVAFKQHVNLLNASRVIVLYSNTEFGHTFYKEFYNLQDDNTIYTFIEYEDKLHDYKNLIQKIKILEDDVIFIAGQYNSLGNLIKQIREYGFEGRIYGDTHMSSPDVKTIVGSYSEECYYVAPRLNSDIARSIQDEYLERYGIEMDDFSKIMYMGLDLLLSHINDVNSFDNSIILDNINGYEYNGIMKSRVSSNIVNVEFDIKPL